MARFHTFLDDSTLEGQQTIAGIQTNGPTFGIGISSSISVNAINVDNVFPGFDNSGSVGNSANTWNSGQFTNFTVDSTLSIGGTVSLPNDLEIKLEPSATEIAITDNGTYKHIITKNGIGVNTNTTPTNQLEVFGGTYISGNVGVATLNAKTKLHVVGDTIITGISTIGLSTVATVPERGQLSFELQSDTQLRIRVRGIDGVLRSATINLA